MSLLSYNGITLPYPMTTQYSQDAVYDESGTDRMLSKFDITVQTLINADYMEALAPALVGANGPITNEPADIMRFIHTQLMTPRKSLSFTFNGVDLIPTINANRGTVDAANGPQPKSCHFTVLTDTTFIITYHIVANYWVNNNEGTLPVSNQPGNAVLSNRWSETADIDDCNYTTKTREGKFIIRSDKDVPGTVDSFRNQMAVIGVNRGFLRVSASYTVSPDGLSLQYKIVDKEQFKMPPAPAFKAEGIYMENTVVKGSTNIFSGEARVTLWGDKNTNQETLIAVAHALVAAKCLNRGQELTGKLQPFAVTNFGNCSIDMYNNKVSTALQVQYTPRSRRRRDGTPVGSENVEFAATPGSPVDGRYRPAYLNRGTADVLLQAAKYYDPSIPTFLTDTVSLPGQVATPLTNPGTTRQWNRGLEVGQAGMQRET